MPNPPRSRVALVTGASRGIGRAIALSLADDGVGVALVARDAAALEVVAEEIRARGQHAIIAPADLTNPAEISEVASEVTRTLGPVDLLVNAAGVLDAEVAPWEADPSEWWTTMVVNVRAPFLLATALVPGMLERGGGRVIDLNSGSGCRDQEFSSGYNVSKTALMRLGMGMHQAGFERGLRVFELAPGVVKTDMTLSMPSMAERTEWTPVEATTTVVRSIARGELDQCSGWFIRVTHDTPESLRELAANPGVSPRRLRVRPANPADPLADMLAE